MFIHFITQYIYDVEVLSIFIVYKTCHLECHFDTTIAVLTSVMHEADNGCSIRSN